MPVFYDHYTPPYYKLCTYLVLHRPSVLGTSGLYVWGKITRSFACSLGMIVIEARASANSSPTRHVIFISLKSAQVET